MDGRTDDPASSPGVVRPCRAPSGRLERFYGPGACLRGKTADRADFAVFPGQDRHPAPHPHRHPARFERNAPPPGEGGVAVVMTVKTDAGGGPRTRGLMSGFGSGTGPGAVRESLARPPDLAGRFRRPSGPIPDPQPDTGPARHLMLRLAAGPEPPAARPVQTSAGDPLSVRWHPAGSRPAGRLPDGTQRTPSGSPADAQRTLVRACAANPSTSEAAARLARLPPTQKKTVGGETFLRCPYITKGPTVLLPGLAGLTPASPIVLPPPRTTRPSTPRESTSTPRQDPSSRGPERIFANA